MTTLNNDGFVIDAQDLSSASPGSADHQRVYNHDGASSINLTDGSTTSKRGWYMWDNPQSAWFPMGQHADLVDGYHGQDLAAIGDSRTITGSWTFDTAPTGMTDDSLEFERIPVSTSHAKWADGLSNKEVFRYDLPSGKKMEVHAVSTSFRGGGSSSNFTLDVYDNSDSTVLASDNAGGAPTLGSPIATSVDGATVLIRISNSTGNYQFACIEADLHIV